jgi:hypothetical protein
VTELVVLAGVIGVAVLAVVIVSMRRRSTPAAGGKRAQAKRLHTMQRERSIGYFQDLSGRGAAPGVQEEDRTGRWGSGDEAQDR